MKKFIYRLKHEHYIERKINAMTSEQLIIKVIDNWIAVNKNGKKLQTFQKIFDNDCMLELCKRYRVNLIFFKEEFARLTEQRMNGEKIKIGVGINEISKNQ